MTISHNLMPGDVVYYQGKQGKVIARGVKLRRQYVEISFPDSSKTIVKGDDIRNIVKR